MKKFLLSIALLAASFAANAQHSVALADAVWNVDDMQYYDHAGYKKNSTHSSNTTSYIYANWCVDNESKRKTLRGSAAYIPSIHPNKYTLSQASTPNTVKYGMDDTLAIRMYHNAGNYKQFIMLPRISDAAYTNLELEFYARRGVTNTETDASKLSIGYIVLNTLDDTLAVFDNVVNLQSLNITNGTYDNGYNKYTISLATLPANAQVVFYEGTEANNIVYLDNISIKTKGGVNPGPTPEPTNPNEIRYNLTGCSIVGEAPEEAEYDEDAGYTAIEFYLTADDGYTLENAEITVMHGETEIALDDWGSEVGYVYYDPSYSYFYCIYFDEPTEGFDITINCKAATAPEITLPETPAAATFEEFTLEENSIYRVPTWEVGKNYWLSGSYLCATEKASWGGYSEIQVVNFKNQYKPSDFSDAYLACCADGAAEGNNFAVCNVMGLFVEVTLTPTTVSGMYVTNTQAARTGFTVGDGYARAFHQGDWFKLTITGVRNGVATGSVDYYLADYRTATFTYAEDWQWVDLTSLGEVDALQFSIDGTDKGAYGLNTAAYFCFDNLGGAAPSAPTSVENVAVENVEKQLFNGQLIIRRGEHLYNAAGQMIK